MSKNIIFSTSTELTVLPADTIVYIIADGNYSTIRTLNGEKYVLTLQLGHIERHVANTLGNDEPHFIRIGKSLMVNCQFINYINPTRQRLILSDCRTFRYELSASKEALKSLKEYLEKEVVE